MVRCRCMLACKASWRPVSQGTVPTGRWDDFLAAINASYFNADAERTALLQAIPDLLMRLDANGRILAATFTGDDSCGNRRCCPAED